MDYSNGKVLQMDNCFEDRYGNGETEREHEHGFDHLMDSGNSDDMNQRKEGSHPYLETGVDMDTDMDIDMGIGIGIDALDSSTSPYYLNNLDGIMGSDGDFSSHMAADDDFLPNPNDALGHADLFSSETGALLGGDIGAKHSQMDEGLMKDMSSMIAHDLVGGMMLDDVRANNKLMNVCLLHGGLEFASRQERDDAMEDLVVKGLLLHSEDGTYRCNTALDNSNNVGNSDGEENENILLHRNAVLFPAMHCSEDLLDRVMEFADRDCKVSYIKFVHIAEDTTIVAELVDGKETIYHDDLASIVEFLKIDDSELASVVNTELQNDDELSLKIYDSLVEWINEDGSGD